MGCPWDGAGEVCMSLIHNHRRSRGHPQPTAILPSSRTSLLLTPPDPGWGAGGSFLTTSAVNTIIAPMIETYKQLFVQRTDTYGRQREHSRLYYRVKKP